jgi:hypothetical protein
MIRSSWFSECRHAVILPGCLQLLIHTLPLYPFLNARRWQVIFFPNLPDARNSKICSYFKMQVRIRIRNTVCGPVCTLAPVWMYCIIKLCDQGGALFPHILTKNQDFTVNFGQLPAPLFPLLPGKLNLFHFMQSDICSLFCKFLLRYRMYLYPGFRFFDIILCHSWHM